jgi:hypothetical protein
LFAHQCLEGRKRHIAMHAANAPQGFEAPFVHGGSSHAHIDESADNSLAQPAGGDARLELGDPRLQ